MGSSTVADVTRSVPNPVQRLLWGRAGGRCQFAGCNKPLWKSSVTQERVNIAQKAHIHGFSPDGPRGRTRLPQALLNAMVTLVADQYEVVD